MRDEAARGRSLGGAACLALAPWFGLVYALAAVPTLVALVMWTSRRKRPLLAFLAVEVGAASAVALAGVAQPDARTEVDPLGVLVDVLGGAPILALAFVGAALLVRSRVERVSRAIPARRDAEVAAALTGDHGRRPLRRRGVRAGGTRCGRPARRRPRRLGPAARAAGRRCARARHRRARVHNVRRLTAPVHWALRPPRRSLGSMAGPDHYEHVELDTATRLGGAMLLSTALFATVAVLISPPSGPLGWPGVGAALAWTIVVGGIQVARKTASRPGTLQVGVYLSLACAAVFRASAGPDAPFGQVLFVVAVYACMIHPLRHAVVVLASASALAVTPALYETVDRHFAAETVSRLLLIWCCGLIVATWMIRVRQQRREAKANSELARIDPLTQLQNRRALQEALDIAVLQHRRHHRDLSVLVADLDDFKSINDTFGHQVGDEVLRKVAQSLAAALRLSDPCYRWGGDEFVALLPEAGYGEASDIADRICETVAASCRMPDGRPVKVSVGAAQLASDETGEALLERADVALLDTKAARRLAPAAVA